MANNLVALTFINLVCYSLLFDSYKKYRELWWVSFGQTNHGFQLPCYTYFKVSGEKAVFTTCVKVYHAHVLKGVPATI